MYNKSKIPWKLYKVSITAPDRTILRGEITYWAKDYSIHMTSPYQIDSCGSHLQYAIPAVYVTDEPAREKIHQINLIERAEAVLLDIYKKECLC